jgi:hypothetical protein
MVDKSNSNRDSNQGFESKKKLSINEILEKLWIKYNEETDPSKLDNVSERVDEILYWKKLEAMNEICGQVKFDEDPLLIQKQMRD